MKSNKKWWNQRLIAYYLIESPNRENHYSTHYKKLFALGKHLDKEGKKLECVSIRTLKLGTIQIQFNYNPRYY